MLSKQFVYFGTTEHHHFRSVDFPLDTDLSVCYYSASFFFKTPIVIITFILRAICFGMLLSCFSLIKYVPVRNLYLYTASKSNHVPFNDLPKVK